MKEKKCLLRKILCFFLIVNIAFYCFSCISLRKDEVPNFYDCFYLKAKLHYKNKIKERKVFLTIWDVQYLEIFGNLIIEESMFQALNDSIELYSLNNKIYTFNVENIIIPNNDEESQLYFNNTLYTNGELLKFKLTPSNLLFKINLKMNLRIYGDERRKWKDEIEYKVIPKKIEIDSLKELYYRKQNILLMASFSKKNKMNYRVYRTIFEGIKTYVGSYKGPIRR